MGNLCFKICFCLQVIAPTPLFEDPPLFPYDPDLDEFEFWEMCYNLLKEEDNDKDIDDYIIA